MPKIACIILLLGLASNGWANGWSKGPLDCDTLTLSELSVEARKQFFSSNREDAFYLFVCALKRFAREDNDIKEFLIFHNAFAAALIEIGANELCIQHARKAYQISEAYYNKHSFGIKGAVLYGNHLLMAGYPDSALFYYRKAYNIKKVRTVNPNFKNDFNNLGMAFSDMGLQDSAIHYYRLGLSTLGGFTSGRAVEGIDLAIYDNYIRSLWKAGKLAPSSAQIDTFQTYCEKYGSPIRQKKCWALLAEIFNDFGLFHQSGQYIQKLLKLHREKRSMSPEVNQLRIDKVVLEHARGVENWEDVGVYTNRVVRQTDSIAKLNKRFLELIISAQRYYDEAINHVEQRMVKAEMDRNEGLDKQLSLTRWLRGVSGLAFFVLLSIVAILWVYNRKQKAFKREKEIIKRQVGEKQSRLLKLEEEIELKQRDLEKVTLYVNSMKDSRNALRQVLERSIKQKGDESKRTIQRLLMDNKSQEQLVNRSDVLFANVREVSEGFYKRLKQRFPDLSPAEVEFCAYIRAGLSTPEIAHLRNIQPKSVRMTKYRLKKKLSLRDEMDIGDFVKDL